MKYCMENYFENIRFFSDKGITGTSMKKRVEFKKMITACKRGCTDLILTKSPSRFARNTVDSLEVVWMLQVNGIGVIFEKENIYNFNGVQRVPAHPV